MADSEADWAVVLEADKVGQVLEEEGRAVLEAVVPAEEAGAGAVDVVAEEVAAAIRMDAAVLTTASSRASATGGVSSLPTRAPVFITLQNSALNAAPFSLNGQAQPKPSSDNAKFGVNIGGPMVIPKILNWQRASFYFTYQGTQSRNPYSSVSTVPTAAERGGDFSAISNIIYDPLTGAPFPGNMIPASRFNPAPRDCSNTFRNRATAGSSRITATSLRLRITTIISACA